MINNSESTPVKKHIVSTKILVEWSDDPKMQVLLNDMPKQLLADNDRDWETN